MSDNDKALWTIAMREIEAESRLNLQADFNAAMFPRQNRDLRLRLAQLAYADDPKAYEEFVYSIAFNPATSQPE